MLAPSSDGTTGVPGIFLMMEMTPTPLISGITRSVITRSIFPRGFECLQPVGPL
jgi:hypothetical protein